jgi:hypothetical protein
MSAIPLEITKHIYPSSHVWADGETNFDLWYAIIDRYGMPPHIRRARRYWGNAGLRVLLADEFIVVKVLVDPSVGPSMYHMFGFYLPDFDLNLNIHPTGGRARIKTVGKADIIMETPSHLFL